ncbi:MAG TPA: hypothetical protein V6C72_15285, partial [Chroococcales cyanobacterium]
RNFRTVSLPNCLSRADMVAVAKVHAPDFEEGCLRVIANMAAVSANYLQAVEAIIKLARYFARKRKHNHVTDDDVKAAGDEVLPQARTANPPETEVEAPFNADSTSLKRAFKPVNFSAPPRGATDTERLALEPIAQG